MEQQSATIVEDVPIIQPSEVRQSKITKYIVIGSALLVMLVMLTFFFYTIIRE